MENRTKRVSGLHRTKCLPEHQHDSSNDSCKRPHELFRFLLFEFRIQGDGKFYITHDIEVRCLVVAGGLEVKGLSGRKQFI